MARKDVFIKAALVLLLVWGCVWGIRTYAASRKITAERVNREAIAANLADWSKLESPPDPAEEKRREEKIRRVAGMVNQLDFQEREKNRGNRSGENFFRNMSPSEKSLFVNLTIAESMGRFMEALDAMPPAQRKKFVEDGLKDIKEGRTGDDMARADALDPQLLDKISREGMRAYFEKSSADTKLDLAPLMEAMNESMQGLRGNEFGPRR